jgi:16S rRNA (guanine527-N7)-methyltransferase
LAAIDRFIALLVDENSRQNLISASTIPSLWVRHIVDSAQLLDHAPADGAWLDLGAGAGFPGLIVATMGARPVDLVESRAKRVQFLEAAAATLATPGVAVLAGRAETIPAKPYRVISARAFAPLERLFAIGQRFADKDTVWLLPKGRNAAAELAEARKTWQGDFALVPSVTDAESAILIARGVSLGRRR